MSHILMDCPDVLSNSHSNLITPYGYRVHIETTSVLIHQFPVDLVKKPDNCNYAPSSMGERGR